MPKHNHTQKILRSLKLSVLALAALCLSGCDAARNCGPNPHQTKESDGIRYKLVKLEGKTFVATQTYHGFWTLAGPID